MTGGQVWAVAVLLISSAVCGYTDGVLEWPLVLTMAAGVCVFGFLCTVPPFLLGFYRWRKACSVQERH